MAYSRQNPYRTFERPYLPSDHCTPATYRLDIGPFFYFGSGRRVGGRVSHHTLALKRGKHTNTAMQKAWDDYQSVAFVLLDVLEQKPGETKKLLTRRLEMHEQWHLDSYFGDPRCLNSSNNSGFNSGASRAMKAKWADPEWRARQREIMEPVWERPVSEETRTKMKEAKLGKPNARSRACTVFCGGEWIRFPHPSAAAAHFGVTQQCMYGWMSGSFLCPGHPCARRKPKNPKLSDLMAAFDKTTDGGKEFNAQYALITECGRPSWM